LAVAPKVADFVLPPQITELGDLQKDLIVVPTRQAGRRLREALAVHCADQGAALLPPLVVTPPFFLRSEADVAKAANPTEIAAIWAYVLLHADLTELRGLLPSTPRNDFAWALYTGQMIQSLRDTLADGGYLITDVLRDFGSILEEPERWQDLARLETAYLEHLAALRLQDPCVLKIKRAEQPELPAGIQRIVVAAVPDPTPLMVRALERLAEQVPVVILIHAPESLADHFDQWGRPIPERWREARIDIPDPETNVLLAGSPASQSQKVLELMAEEASRFGPDDIAIGVPDTGVTPYLAADLEERGLPTFDPAGKPVGDHPLYQLLDAFRALVNEGTYPAFSGFVRHADVLEFLQKKHNLSPGRLLKEMDTFQNHRLPAAWADVDSFFADKPGSAQGERQEYETLAAAVQVVREQLAGYEASDVDAAVRSLFQTVYEARTLNPNAPQDQEFTESAEVINSTLAEFSRGVVVALGIDKKNAMTLLLRRLREQRYFTERQGARIDLEGWLELHWNDAPFLMVTGMNEGAVPDGRVSDVFLPDSLRSQLGLRSDADRLARDAYLMRAMIESRRAKGRACFIAGKTNAEGEPVKPSRLLFRCDDEELPRRAERLFGDADEKRENHAATISFALEASPPADLPTAALDIQTMRVTDFRDYLACPFRFYLKHVLRMEEMDDQKREMDAMDFGLLVHSVLQRMAQSETMRRCENVAELRDFLCGEAERWVADRFGPSPPLQIRIQLGAAKQRLVAAAQAHAVLVREGWETLYAEAVFELELGGILVRGKIDRIDRHQGSGTIRVLDYKTSDTAADPEKGHTGSWSPDAREYARVEINGKDRRWTDLQLPLYKMMLAESGGMGDPIELGFFNIPKAVADTGVVVWTTFTEDILRSARTCAEGVARDIRDHRFWPPAARVEHDDFERIFPADIAQCVNAEAFEAFLEGMRG